MEEALKSYKRIMIIAIATVVLFSILLVGLIKCTLGGVKQMGETRIYIEENVS